VKAGIVCKKLLAVKNRWSNEDGKQELCTELNWELLKANMMMGSYRLNLEDRVAWSSRKKCMRMVNLNKWSIEERRQCSSRKESSIK
jgi:hypothetical protein